MNIPPPPPPTYCTEPECDSRAIVSLYKRKAKPRHLCGTCYSRDIANNRKRNITIRTHAETPRRQP